MNKVILTDVDGVLLDWHSMFKKWMTGKGFVEDTEAKCYSLAKRYGIEEASATALVRQFNTSAAVGFCGPERDAIHYVQRLSERGYTFIAITAMGGDRFSEQLRIQNLERLFGHVFTNHYFVDLNASKEHVLELFRGTEYWWIEDKLSNAEQGLSLGLRPILISHDHNSHYESDDILVADNWKQVYTYITGEQYVQ